MLNCLVWVEKFIFFDEIGCFGLFAGKRIFRLIDTGIIKKKIFLKKMFLNL